MMASVSTSYVTEKWTTAKKCGKGNNLVSNPIARAWEAFMALATGGLAKRVDAAKKEAERVVREAEEQQKQLLKEAREEAQKTRAASRCSIPSN